MTRTSLKIRGLKFHQGLQVFLPAVFLLLGACDDGGGSPEGKKRLPPAPAEAFPEEVSVDQAGVTVGFKLDRKHSTARVEGFTISKSPVTVAQYETCVSQGVC